MERYILDVPIYRISEDDFWNAFALYGKTVATRFDWPPAPSIDAETRRDEILRQGFNAPWQFNQIVGWIRLYALSTQLAGELWLHRAKRYVSSPRRKRFQWNGKAFEMEASEFVTNGELVAALRDNIIGSVAELHNGKLFADLETFNNVADHVDWLTLIDC